MDIRTKEEIQAEYERLNKRFREVTMHIESVDSVDAVERDEINQIHGAMGALEWVLKYYEEVL